MKILLLGASGMLGFALHRKLHDAGLDVIGSIRSDATANTRWARGLRYSKDVRIEDFASLERAVDSLGPEVVINATGVRSLGSVNGDWSTLLTVNSAFPRRVGQLCDSRRIHFVHFSSDGVFSGERGNYDESSLPDAQDPYGTSKFLGEVQTATALVLRLSLLGRGLARNDSMVDWFLAQTGPVRGYRRAVFSGLPVNEVAAVVGRVLGMQTPLTGLYHLAAAPISKFEVLNLLSAAWSHAVPIEPDDSVVLDRSLDATKLNAKIGYRPLPWPQLVDEMRDFYEGLETS